MKRYCSAPTCQAEFDINNSVQLCIDCAVGQDAWHHWFALNDPRFVSNDETRPMWEPTTGRIRSDYYFAVHRIIAAELDGVVNFKNIDRAAKLHLQRQVDVARQQVQKQAAFVRQQQSEREMEIAAKEYIADRKIAAHFQKLAKAKGFWSWLFRRAD